VICLRSARAEIDLRYQRVEAAFLEHKMHMTRPVRMAAELLQKFADWAVVRNRIRHRKDRFEPESTRLVTGQDCPAVWPWTIAVLYIVEALRVSFPDVDFGSGYRIAIDVFDSAQNEKWLPTWICGDGTTMLATNGFVSVECSKDRAICAAFWLRVIDGVDQQGETQDV
jgi:hypothetical protein